MEIQVLKTAKKVIEEAVLETVNLEYPTTHKYYRMVDDGRFFARGVILFAIVVKSPSTFLLFEVERGKQFYTDFMPSKDCKQDDFIKSESDIRRKALKIMLGEMTVFREISESDFLAERIDLLNAPLQDIL